MSTHALERPDLAPEPPGAVPGYWVAGRRQVVDGRKTASAMRIGEVDASDGEHATLWGFEFVAHYFDLVDSGPPSAAG